VTGPSEIKKVEIRKKPGPASRTRPDIRERWGRNTPSQQSASVLQGTDGRKRPASPEEEEETRKRRPEESGSIELSSSSDESVTEESTASKALGLPEPDFSGKEGEGHQQLASTLAWPKPRKFSSKQKRGS
jgi:hypothetical protein